MDSSDAVHDERTLSDIQHWLRSADSVLVLTGAGISTDSGIADFRGPQGVWTKDPDAAKLSNIFYYMNDRAIRVKAWRSRLESPAFSAQPNAGHRALVDLERRGRLDTLVTQNTDGLHLAAGNSPERIVEIHGTVRKVRCMHCDYRVDMSVIAERLRAGEDDPDCPECGGILKSATISFGQDLVIEDLQRAEEAATRCDLLLAVGSTLSVNPIARIVPLAKQSGARIVIVNGRPTAMDDTADRVLNGSISDRLTRLVQGVN